MSASAGINATIVGPAAITFFNDSSYIRAENANTGVVSYFKKSNLTFQADADTSFFLKSDTFKTHYLFADVAKPAVANVKLLLETFQAWIEESDANREQSPFISDTTTTVLEVKTFYDKDPLRIDEILTSSATSTYDAGKNAVAIAITTAQTSRAVRQTKAYASIINNKTMFAVASATLISNTTVRNVVTKVGCFDDNADITAGTLTVGNGVLFQWKSGSGLSLVLRSNITGSQVDTEIAQAAWNIDPLDGTGPSGKTLDPTAENTFIFEWSALKGNTIRLGYIQDGFPIFCHKFLNVRMGCASVPLRWEIARIDPALAIDSNDAASMIQAAGSVMIQGNNDGPVITRSFTNAVIKSVTSASSPQPVLTICLQPGSCRAKLLPRCVRLINLDQGIARWSLLLNPTLTGATYTTLSNSYAQYSENATAVTGGSVLATGFFGNGTMKVDLNEKSLGLYARINGTADTLSLVVEYLRGVVTVSSSLEWIEME